VRAANTGYSAIIDAQGRVRERSALFERGYLIADVRLGGGPGAAGASFFARHGAVFVRGCWLGVLLLVAVALRARFAARGRSGLGGAVDAPGTSQGTTRDGAVEAGEG
jgi:apolipoprotein N-acyltransferase